jgi:hypothetical protein
MATDRGIMEAFRSVAAFTLTRVTHGEVSKRSVRHINRADAFTSESVYEFVRGPDRYVYFPPRHTLPWHKHDEAETFVTMAGDSEIWMEYEVPEYKVPADLPPLPVTRPEPTVMHSDSGLERGLWKVPVDVWHRVQAGDMGCVLRGTVKPRTTTWRGDE